MFFEEGRENSKRAIFFSQSGSQDFFIGKKIFSLSFFFSNFLHFHLIEKVHIFHSKTEKREDLYKIRKDKIKKKEFYQHIYKICPKHNNIQNKKNKFTTHSWVFCLPSLKELSISNSMVMSTSKCTSLPLPFASSFNKIGLKTSFKL